jgi:hypothetical protein
VVTQIQKGATTKQAIFVIIVTSRAIESFPPARRVQTAAEANVLGIAAAINSPMLKSAGDSHRDAGQAANGSTTALIAIASSTAPGRRMARHMALASSVTDIKNSTAATMAFCGMCRLTLANGPGSKNPISSSAARPTRNQ